MASDQELIERILLLNDRAAFETLYARHAGRVKAYLLRSGFRTPRADDLTQDVFLRVYRSLETFDGDKGRFSTWLGTIARNVARKQWAARGDEESLDPELAERVLGGENDPSAWASAEEELAAVGECVERLSGTLKRIVQLRYVEARTTRAIGEALDMPESTVRKRLDEARQAVGRCLAEKGILE